MSKTCLITGSSRGIGLAIAQYLAQHGYHIIFNDLQSIDDRVKESFDKAGYSYTTVIGDVSDFAQAKEMIDQVIAEVGQLDILINNAGITRDGLLMRMKETDWDQVIAVNLKGAFNMSRHAVPYMIKQKSGKIINLSSVVGLMGNAGQVNYAASKAGLIGLTKSIAREVGSRHITVNAIAPGFIQTQMTDQLSDKVKESMLEQIVLKRFGQVEEVAHVVKFLIENDYITGQTIEINGGLHI